METSFNYAINKILTDAAKRKALNVHLAVGAYPALRIDDELLELSGEPLVTSEFISQLAESWLAAEQQRELKKNKEIIFAKDIGKKFRLKVNLFFQKNFLSASIRL